LVFLIIVTVTFSCRKEQRDDMEATRMERVIAVHDEMMPKMGIIGKLISDLEPMADSTFGGKPYKVAIDDLKEGYNMMMDWMKEFGDKFDFEEIMEGKALTKEKEAWLIEEEEKVNAMKDKINSSINNAKTLLNALQQ
jgi:hypothetical protein